MKAQFQNKQEAEKTIELAMGRILSMGVRPSKKGDTVEYERCKWLILDAGEYLEALAK